MASSRKPTRRGDDKGAVGSDAKDEGGAFSIRVVSRLTSIEPDTLRMWERRYGFPKPRRTSGNSRLYSASDVEALKLIVAAMSAGYRPGEIVGKPKRELEALVVAPPLARPAPPAEPFVAAQAIEDTIGALKDDQIDAVRSHIRRAAVLLGPSAFVTSFAHPVSVAVGELWARGEIEVRHEHVFTDCLSSQLRLMLSTFDEIASGPRVLLATLPNEPHGLPLETIAVYLAAHRLVPRLLGVNTPPEQIVRAVRAYDCVAVGLSIMPSYDPAVAAKHLRTMTSELGRRVPIWVGGAGAQALRAQGARLTIVSDWSALDAAIAALHAAR